VSLLETLTNRWPSQRARFLFREVNDRGHNLPLASVTRDRGVEFRADLDISVWNPGDDVSDYKRVQPGDFVIGLRSFQSGLGYSPLEGLVSPAYTVLRPIRPEIWPGYFRHLLKSELLISRLENIAQGIRQGRTIAVEDFNELRLPLPPLVTQRAIADYLDRETPRLDALITAKRRMVELLDEHFRATVFRVTDTGATVAVRRVVSRRTSGPRGWGQLVSSVGAPFIRSANLQRDDLELRNDVLAGVDPPSSVESERSRTRVGDVLVGITGANTGWVGIVGSDHAGGYVSQHVALLRPRGVDSRWLAYSIFCSRAQDQLLGGQYGGTKQLLGLDELAELSIRVPARRDQERLVRTLDHAKRIRDRTKAALQRQLSLLSEHRQALITAAVTGELEIPEAAA